MEKGRKVEKKGEGEAGVVEGWNRQEGKGEWAGGSLFQVLLTEQFSGLVQLQQEIHRLGHSGGGGGSVLHPVPQQALQL